MRILQSLLLVVSLVEIAGAEPAPAQMPAADVNKWLGFFDKLVTTVVKAETTCEKLALDVSNVIDTNQDAVKIAREARAAGKKLPEAAQQHMLDGVKKMVPAMRKCGQHAKVRSAFAKLDLNRKPATASR